MSIRNRTLPSGAKKFEASVSNGTIRIRALFDTRAEAKEWELEERNKIRDGTFLATRSKVLVRDFIKSYTEELKGQVKSNVISEAFYDIKVAHMKNYVCGGVPFKRNAKYEVIFVYGIGDYYLTKLNKDMLETFLSKARETGLTSKGTKDLKNTLIGLLDFAERKRCLAANPAHGIKIKRSRHEIDDEEISLPPKELIAAMVACAPAWLVLLTKVAILVGLRLGELRALLWADLDMATGELVIRKSLNRRSKAGPTKTRAGRRRVPLSKELRGELLAHRQTTRFARDTDFMFTSRTGGPLVKETLRHHWAKAYQRAIASWPAGVPVPPCPRWHDLRHLCNSLWAEYGMKLKLAQKLMGHKSPQTTQRIYTHVLEHKNRKNAQMDSICAEAIADFMGANLPHVASGEPSSG